jgi:hypothetical protein
MEEYMLKRFKRFFALTTIAALMIQLIPGVSMMKPMVVKALRENNTVSSALDKTSESYNLVLSDLEKVDTIDNIYYQTDGYWSKEASDYNPDEYVEFKFDPEMSEGLFNVSLLSGLHVNSGAINYHDKWEFSKDNGASWTKLNWTTPVTDDTDVNETMNIGQLTAVELNQLAVHYSAYVSATNNVTTDFDFVRLQFSEVDTAPAAVTDINYQITGSKATLSWEANSEQDLAGYEVYGQNKSEEVDYTNPINDTLLLSPTWTSDDLILGQYKYGVKAVDLAGLKSKPTEITVNVNQKDITIVPGIHNIVSSNIEMIGEGMAGNVIVSDDGVDPDGKLLNNSVKVFGHYYKFEDGAKPWDAGKIFPVRLKFYFTDNDLEGLTGAQALNGVYFYDTETSIWKKYTYTGYVVSTADAPISFNGIDYAGYVWVLADHFTPIVQGADGTAPKTSASELASYKFTRTFNVNYTATDSGDGVTNSVDLYYRVNGGEWKLYGTDATLLGKIEFTAPQDGKYEFYTVATDKAGNREDDTDKKLNPEATTNVDTVALGAVTGIKAVTMDGKVVLSWDLDSNAEGYIVSYLDNRVDVGKQNQVTINGLTNGTTYSFSVEAYRAGGNKVSEIAMVTATPQAPAKVAGPEVISAAQAAPTEEVQVAQPTQTIQSQDSSEEVETPVETPSEDQGQVKGDETSNPRNWSTTIVILSILVVLAAAVTGYYGYEWWATKPKKSNSKKKKNAVKTVVKSKKDTSRW